MLKLISSIVFTFLTIYCNAQGSWDIGYLHVDSLKKKHIGQIVRIAFKSNNPWTNSKEQRGIRSYVGMKDTGVITIDTCEVILVERRKIYADHGSYDDQYLECINCNQEVFLIYDAKIVDIDSRSIQFLMDIERKTAGETVKKVSKVIRIDRSKLDGVMIKQ